MSEPEIAFRAERLSGWGMAVGGSAQVAQPTTAEQVAAAMALVAKQHGSLAMRGSGCSYGDASLNTAGHVLDTSGMNRILRFDPERGLITVEPGVTIREVWRQVIAFGWWPPVVPGTMAVSVGGAAGLNIHGKNNFAVGSFGEHIESFLLQTPTGSVLRCSRHDNAEAKRSPHLQTHGAFHFLFDYVPPAPSRAAGESLAGGARLRDTVRRPGHRPCVGGARFACDRLWAE